MKRKRVDRDTQSQPGPVKMSVSYIGRTHKIHFEGFLIRRIKLVKFSFFFFFSLVSSPLLLLSVVYRQSIGYRLHFWELNERPIHHGRYYRIQQVVVPAVVVGTVRSACRIYFEFDGNFLALANEQKEQAQPHNGMIIITISLSLISFLGRFLMKRMGFYMGES